MVYQSIKVKLFDKYSTLLRAMTIVLYSEGLLVVGKHTF